MDPCINFDCKVATVIPTDGYCTYFKKEPNDIDCFLPCMTENCTKFYSPDSVCVTYFCNEKTTTSTPVPFTTFPPEPPIPADVDWALVGPLSGLGKKNYFNPIKTAMHQISLIFNLGALILILIVAGLVFWRIKAQRRRRLEAHQEADDAETATGNFTCSCIVSC